MNSLQSFPKIDAHIHFNADRSNLLNLASDYDFSLLTINTEVPEFPSIYTQNELARQYSHEAYGTRLYHATTVPTENVFNDGWAEYAIEKIKKDVAEGAIGVKFWKNIGMTIQRSDGTFLRFDDPVFEPVFDFMQKEQIPALTHQGEPKNCWLPVEEMTVQGDKDYFSAHPQYHMYKHEEYPDYWQHIEARDHILERYPDLPIVGLHLASLEWNLDEISQRLEDYPCLAVDLAERINHLYDHAAKDRAKVIDFFETYQDRIIYGTDIIDDPGQDPSAITDDLKQRWESHWRFLSTDYELSSDQIEAPFRGLNLPEDILHKIYRKNALHWYNLTDK